MQGAERTVDGSHDGLWDQYDDALPPASPPQSRELGPLQINTVPSIASRCCTRATAEKLVQFILTSGTFATTTYFGVSELLHDGNIVNLTLCAVANGAAVSSFGDLAVPVRYRKKISEFISRWSYETLLAFSQVYLNLAPEKQLKLYALPFIWSLGMLRTKDLFYIKSLTLPDLPLTAIAPPEDELLRTIGFTTRNRSIGAKLLFTGHAVAATGLTILNFTVRDKYATAGDLGKIGIYQDLIAMYTGSVLGELIARISDDCKESREAQHAGRLIINNSPSTSLKILRVAKNAFVILSPLAIGALLAAPTPPNSPEDFAVKAAVGGIYGAQMLVLKREFENPQSFLHSVKAISYSAGRSIVSTCGKVKAAAKKHFPSLCFFTLLTGYMGVAAATNLPKADYAIIVLLLTTFASYIATDQIATRYRPARNNRISNEAAFRMLYSSIALAIFFQYLTTKLSIGDRGLDNDSTEIYILALFAWFFWGVNVGNNRAVYSQDPVPSPVQVTPPITIQELSKTFVGNLQ